MIKQQLLPRDNETEYTLSVPETSISRRLDIFVSEQFPKYSRTFFQKLIEKGLVKVNQKQTKSSYAIKLNDIISVEIPAPRVVAHILSNEAKSQLEQLTIPVIFQNTEFLIIDKPAGLIVHKPSIISTTITLVDWLLYKFPTIATIGDEMRPGIVHRLDKDTSGLMIIALTAPAHKVFSELFAQRKIEKTYLAVVNGKPKQAGIIDLAIGRDILQPTKMSYASHKTRSAITKYEVLHYYQNAALVKAMPLTGRTHQIRVHFAAIKHPIIGDRLYGKESKFINRQALHASELSFIFSNTHFSFKSDLPQDIIQLLNQLENVQKH